MIELQSNRPISWIKCSVSSRICRFSEIGKSSLPYNKSYNRASFLRFTYPSGRINVQIPARTFFLCKSTQGQSNKVSQIIQRVAMG